MFEIMTRLNSLKTELNKEEKEFTMRFKLKNLKLSLKVKSRIENLNEKFMIEDTLKLLRF